MRAFFAVVALVASFATFGFAEEVEVEENVYVLGDNTFKKFVEDNEFVLAEFYAPWCGHCKSLAPEYAKAAGQLKEEGSSIKLAKVDATVHSNIAQEHGVRGYPTLKFFRSGGDIEYTGGRQAADIVNWLKKKTGPAAETVEDLEQHNKLAEDNSVYVIGYFADKESDNAKTFLSAAATYDEGVFGITTSDEVKEALKLEGDAVVLLKHFDDKRADFDGKFEKAAIIEFVNANNLPLVMPFNAQNQPKIFGGAIKSHMLLFDTKDGLAEFEECYAEAAKDFKGKMIFITVDTNDRAVGNVMRYFNIGEGAKKELRLINMDGDMTKFVPEGEVTCETFKPMAKDYFDDKLTPHLNSEEIPEDWDAKPVKVLVGKNFKEVALNKSATVFVAYHAPWCGHCKALAPTWDELGEAFADRDDIVIAKMDATANEVAEVKIQGFPTLKLFPKDSDEIVDYNGGRTLAELKKFVLDHAGAGNEEAKEEEETKEEEKEEEEEEAVERDEL